MVWETVGLDKLNSHHAVREIGHHCETEAFVQLSWRDLHSILSWITIQQWQYVIVIGFCPH